MGDMSDWTEYDEAAIDDGAGGRAAITSLDVLGSLPR